jgi:hypothetical protein
MARIAHSLTAGLVLAWAWVIPAAAQDTSAFFSLVNTYAYASGPRQGERALVRARQTLTVTGFVTDGDGVLWYRAVDPEHSEKLKGSGWVVLDPHELSQKGGQRVLVFPDILRAVSDDKAALEIPASDITLANVSQPSQAFPEVMWQKVTYETNVPTSLYVRAATGIYRPFRSDKFLSDAHAEMVTQGLDNDRLRRLLAGVVRPGDSTQDVRWALGDSIQQEESTAEGLKIQVWHYPGIQVRFENGVVKKIN